MKFRFIIFFFLLIAIGKSSSAQLTAENQKLMQHYEDSLRILNDSLLDGKEQGVRQGSCYDFIRMLVKALKVEHSFSYPFDSLQRIAVIVPPDNSFRIFNWVLQFTDGTFRYYGAIQMNNPKAVKVFPLFDFSDDMDHPQDSTLTADRWYGCLYYRLIPVKAGSKTLYTLIGWDGNNMKSNKKIIDVLWFDKEGKPKFGAPVFDFGSSADYSSGIKRFILEYKEDAMVSVNYDADLKQIVFDHLQPQTPSTKGLYYTYIPDGSYEGFQWKSGKWHYVESVFNTTQKEPPFDYPVNFGKEKKLYTPK